MISTLDLYLRKYMQIACRYTQYESQLMHIKKIQTESCIFVGVELPLMSTDYNHPPCKMYSTLCILFPLNL